VEVPSGPGQILSEEPPVDEDARRHGGNGAGRREHEVPEPAVRRCPVAPNGTFTATVQRAHFTQGICLFAGTSTLASATSGFVKVQ
jgi:hypothetical protein